MLISVLDGQNKCCHAHFFSVTGRTPLLRVIPSRPCYKIQTCSLFFRIALNQVYIPCHQVIFLGLAGQEGFATTDVPRDVYFLPYSYCLLKNEKFQERWLFGILPSRNLKLTRKGRCQVRDFLTNITVYLRRWTFGIFRGLLLVLENLIECSCVCVTGYRNVSH